MWVADDIRRLEVEPVLYRTLSELGLAAFCEVVAFEYMLARLAGRIAAFLATHWGLGPVALRWWTEHADVEVPGLHGPHGRPPATCRTGAPSGCLMSRRAARRRPAVTGS
jgi:hypothetical protein